MAKKSPKPRDTNQIGAAIVSEATEDHDVELLTWNVAKHTMVPKTVPAPSERRGEFTDEER